MKKTMKCASPLLVAVLLLAGCSEKAPETAAELMERVKGKNFDNYNLVLDYGFTVPDVMELSLNMDMSQAGQNAKMDMKTKISAGGEDVSLDVESYVEGGTTYTYVPALKTWSTSTGEEMTTDFVNLAEDMTDVAVMSEEGNSYVLSIPLTEMVSSAVFEDLLGMTGSQTKDGSAVEDILASLFSDAEMKMTFDKKSYEPQYIDFNVSAEGVSFDMHGEFSGYGEVEEDAVSVPEEAKAAIASAAPEGEEA